VHYIQFNRISHFD